MYFFHYYCCYNFIVINILLSLIGSEFVGGYLGGGQLVYLFDITEYICSKKCTLFKINKNKDTKRLNKEVNITPRPPCCARALSPAEDENKCFLSGRPLLLSARCRYTCVTYMTVFSLHVKVQEDSLSLQQIVNSFPDNHSLCQPPKTSACSYLQPKNRALSNSTGCVTD